MARRSPCGWLVGAMIWLLVPTWWPTAAAGDVFGPDQVRQIEAIARQYLLAHPEVIGEVQALWRAEAVAARKAEARARIAPYRDRLISAEAAFVAGDPDGSVTVVEFFDYRCSDCKRWHADLTELRAQDPDLRVVYREYPILGSDSTLASRAAIASRRQGRYLAFHDALMTSRGALMEAAVMEIATETGLDAEQLRTDMSDPAVQAVIDHNSRLGVALDLLGTPSFIVGDRLLDPWQDIAALKAMIARQRAQ
ncbi:MAG: DsbA family protein [Alphaproteobacteria bacterium]|nr:DsbA family protein [Alphaproteobacteria bacterium]